MEFHLAANVTYTVVLNESNAHYLMMYNPIEFAMDVNRLTPEAWYTKENLPYGKIDIIKEQPVVRLYPGKDSLYVNYWAYNYESPPFFGKANITYTGGLFVLDKEGRLLWSKLTDSYITGVSERMGPCFMRQATNLQLWSQHCRRPCRSGCIPLHSFLRAGHNIPSKVT